ncbi:MAG: outer membrane beta-barrel protein [Thermodesulfobacteriota bacterium]
MKKTISVISVTMLLASASAISAKEGAYVGGSLGVGLASDADATEAGATSYATFESDAGVTVGLTGGYRLPNNLRVEGELSYQSNDFDTVTLSMPGFSVSYPLASGDVTRTSLLVNGYYDIPTSSNFTPYASLGLGFSKIDVGDFTFEDGESVQGNDDTVFTYQFTAGVAYALSETLAIDAKVSYLATSDADINFEGDVISYEYATTNLQLGLRYGF